MIAMLSTALGLAAYAPAFWMPLACMAALFLVLAGAVAFDGIDIGVGCLCACAPAPLRPRMLALLNPGRDANQTWLLLGLGLFLTAFPHAVQPLLGSLTLPLSLLALGTLLRSVCFAFHLRAPLAMRAPWQMGFAAGAWMVAAAHGLLLAAFVMPFDAFSNRNGFTAFVVLGVIAAYALFGATWLIMRENGALRRNAIRWARRALRWAVAGAVGVCTMLALANPAIFMRWGSDLPWQALTALWLAMLVSVVVMEAMLRQHRIHQASALPFMLTLLMLLTVLGGLCYSVFPYVLLYDITLWQAAAPVASLRLVLIAWLVAVPVMVVFNLRVYCGMFGAARAPQTPAYAGITNTRT